MNPRWRIIEPPPEKPTFAELVEREARRITKRTADRLSHDEPSAIVEREMAMTLDHLDRARGFQSALLTILDGMERDLNQKMRGYTPRQPQYGDPWELQRERLSSRLQRVQEERRRLQADHHAREQTLTDRLLAQWHKHLQLSPDDG